MKYIYISLTIAAISVSLSGCDYLDKREETEGMTTEEVFGNAINYENYVEWMIQNPLIRYLQDESRPQGSWDDVSDNSMSTMTTGNPSLWSAQGDYLTMMTNARATICNEDTWGRMWQHVRIANMGISHIDMYPGDQAGREKILGICYFYRAFAYFELCRRWGGMPYMTEPVEDLSQNLDMARDDMRTTYLKVADDFEEASKYLKPTLEPTEWQHPTSVAALAMKSRALLYAASPQATEENGVSRENLWEAAADAAMEAIKMAEDNGYALADGANYYDIFKGQNTDVYTKEVLFGRRAHIQWGAMAYTHCMRPPGKLNGKNGVAANQKFIDCFDMVNGYPITDERSGYYDQNPYVDRGLRFEHNFLYNQKTIYDRKMDLYNQVEGSATMGGGDIKYNNGEIATGFTKTGTYVIKWMGKDWQAALDQVWPYIRMAELYLNYAEAASEAGWDMHTAPAGFRYSPLEALNLIRNRAGIADLPEDYQTPEKFNERVKNERRVELCFEDHRFFDIRRWLIGTDPDYDNDIYRVNIVKLKDGYDAEKYPMGYRYEYVQEPVRMRVYEERHNLFPIKLSDTYIGHLFTQNPGW